MIAKQSFIASASTYDVRLTLILIAAMSFILAGCESTSPKNIPKQTYQTPASTQSKAPTNTTGPKIEIIGAWYDDIGSPNFGNAVFTITQENGHYYLTRENADGSGGKYPLFRDGPRFDLIGDKFGAYYVITPNGLNLNDRQGYIRTAKTLSPQPN